MFDISALKEMKLSELQEIAKAAKTLKFNGVKKDTLINAILEHQSASDNFTSPQDDNSNTEDDKSKRVRILPVKKIISKKETPVSLVVNDANTVDNTVSKSEMELTAEQNNADTVSIPEKKESKIIKFSKSAYEKKIALKKEKEESK